jgi:membrane protein
MRAVYQLFRDAIDAYLNDRSAIYAAGLAYYAVFAIAPLLLLVGSIASILVGRALATTQILQGIEYFVGPELARYLADIVTAVSRDTFSSGGTVVSIAGMVLGGVGIVTQLDLALNYMWGLEKAEAKTWSERLVLLRHRLAPFLVVLFLGLMLGFGVLLNTRILGLTARVVQLFPALAVYEPRASLFFVPALVFLAFLAIYKWLPDARSRWRDVAVGAAVTTLIFLVGTSVLALYLQVTDSASLFGAASSIIVLLIWIDVSAHIVLFGAEFTKLYADRYGQPIVPNQLTTFVEEAPVTPDA